MKEQKETELCYTTACSLLSASFPQKNLKSNDLNQPQLKTMGVCVLTSVEFGLTWDCKISEINTTVMLLKQQLNGQEIPEVKGFP